MTVNQLITNLFTEDKTVRISMVAYAGSFNVSSGFAEFKSMHFPACAACADRFEVVRECEFCGRKVGNNIQVPVSGGQVATGASLYVGQKLIGSVFIFDDLNSLAASIDTDLHGGSLKEIDFQNTFQEKFIDELFRYGSLPCFEVGNFEARYDAVADVGFVVGDSRSGHEPYATVDHPFANGDFKLLLFSEPLSTGLGRADEILAFLSERGYRPEVTPRVALAIDSGYVTNVLKNIEPVKQDSAQQTALLDADPLSESELRQNACSTNLMNGLFWSYAAYDQANFYRDKQGSQDIWYLYSTRALGFFVQGALGGNKDCLSLAQQSVEAFPDYLEDVVLGECLKPRGLHVSEAIRNLLAG